MMMVDTEALVFGAHLFATTVMTGIIWFMQIGISQAPSSLFSPFHHPLPPLLPLPFSPDFHSHPLRSLISNQIPYLFIYLIFIYLLIFCKRQTVVFSILQTTIYLSTRK